MTPPRMEENMREQATATTAAAKPTRRVRSGCLACRARRRKCDEAKPACRACQARSVVCRYEDKAKNTRLRFVHADSDSFMDRRPACVPTAPDFASAAASASSPAFVNLSASSALTPPATLPPAVVLAPPAPVDSPTATIQNVSSDITQSCRDGLYAVPPATADLLPTSLTVALWSSTHQCADMLPLLNFYRYRIAPVLDLTPAETYWSSTFLRMLGGDLRASSAFLSLMRWLKNRVEAIASATPDALHIHPSLDVVESRRLEYPLRLLLTWQLFLYAEPSAWLTIFHSAGLFLSENECPAECHLWWLRLSLASSLAAEFHPVLTTTSTTPGDEYPLSQQAGGPGKASLLGSLVNLKRTLSFVHEGHSLHRPVASLWLSCWTALQIWYANRGEELQPVLEVTGADIPESVAEPQAAFPPIIFGDSVAVLANIAHHMSAVLLLRARPRLVTALAEPGSSTSLIWHALRIQSIGAVAVEDRFWDPLLAVALTRSGGVLSHASQLSAVAENLRSLMAFTGMQLDGSIEAFVHAAAD